FWPEWVQVRTRGCGLRRPLLDPEELPQCDDSQSRGGMLQECSSSLNLGKFFGRHNCSLQFSSERESKRGRVPIVIEYYFIIRYEKKEKLLRVLAVMLDESEFLSP